MSDLIFEPLSYGQTMQFNTFGYLVLSGRIDSSGVARLGPRLDRVLDATGSDAAAPWNTDAALGIDLLSDAHLTGVAQSLLGHDCVFAGLRCERSAADETGEGGRGLMR